MEYMIIGFCAALGGIARYLVGLMLPATTLGFPWGTLAANLTGAFLLAYITHYFVERTHMSAAWATGWGTGFCGAYTTFSSFCVDSIKLLYRNAYWEFGAYILLSLVGGLVVTLIAFKIADWQLMHHKQMEAHEGND